MVLLARDIRQWDMSSPTLNQSMWWTQDVECIWNVLYNEFTIRHVLLMPCFSISTLLPLLYYITHCVLMHLVVTCRYLLLLTYLNAQGWNWYMFVVVNFDALAQASDIRIARRQVVFLCWRQDSNPSGSQTPNRQQTECPLTNRLSYRGSS